MTDSGRRTTKGMLVAVLETGGFTVGENNGLSGFFVSDGSSWQHRGWVNTRGFGVAVSPVDPNRILLAAGNGVLGTRDGGTSWRVLTTWRITEVLDVTFDPRDPERIICATAYGIWYSPDDGSSWIGASDGLASTFIQSLSVSASEPTIWAGTEEGVFAAALDDLIWRRDGLVGFLIRQVVTSGNDLQAAVTKSQGAWVRRTGGPWTRIRGVPADATCYAVAIDPRDHRTVAIGGLFRGIYLSRDAGRSATLIASDAPESPVHAIKFDEATGAVVVGTTGEGIFELRGTSWSDFGLPRASVRRII